MKPSTCKKYRQALEEFRELCRTNELVSASDFASQRSIDRGFVKRLERCGFVHKKGFQLYQWTGKPINEDTLEELSQHRHAENQSPVKPTAVAANDVEPVQKSLDLNWKDNPFQKAEPQYPNLVKHMHKQVEALERRVASLEQLLIRRSIA